MSDRSWTEAEVKTPFTVTPEEVAMLSREHERWADPETHSPSEEPYCELCGQEGHTLRSCPTRDDLTDEPVCPFHGDGSAAGVVVELGPGPDRCSRCGEVRETRAPGTWLPIGCRCDGERAGREAARMAEMMAAGYAVDVVREGSAIVDVAYRPTGSSAVVVERTAHGVEVPPVA